MSHPPLLFSNCVSRDSDGISSRRQLNADEFTLANLPPGLGSVRLGEEETTGEGGVAPHTLPEHFGAGSLFVTPGVQPQ